MDALAITRSIDINAPIDRVWKALTEADLIAQWFGDACEFDAVPGGGGYFGWAQHGKHRVVVEHVEAPRVLVYRWAQAADAEPVPGNSTVVRFELTEIDGGTRLDLVETGFENLEDPQASLADNTGGWTAELAELVDFVQAGA